MDATIIVTRDWKFYEEGGVSTVALALPALALLVWITIGHSLAPLYSASKEIRMRDAGKLDPVKVRDKLSELHPMIDALNSLLLRIQRLIDRELEFTSNTAGELMTPIAVIKVQAQVALVGSIQRSSRFEWSVW
jgi:two-component system, OmpR family, sensor histidine kinase QseC